jgi:Protein of unknown function (DUF3348)
MTRVSPRAHLHDASLLQFVQEQGWAPSEHDSVEVGQKLSDWLHFKHAIALQGLLDQNELRAQQPAQAASIRINATVLKTRFDEVRQALQRSITEGSSPAPSLPRITPLARKLDWPIDATTAFEPYRRFVYSHQRQMENVISGLRAQLRGMLSKGDSAWQQLGMLDAAFAAILNERESKLLLKLTSGFEKRFHSALKKHLKALQAASDADEPAPDTETWLPALCQQMQSALLHELDIRLQPIEGLMDALTHKQNKNTYA